MNLWEWPHHRRIRNDGRGVRIAVTCDDAPRCGGLGFFRTKSESDFGGRRP